MKIEGFFHPPNRCYLCKHALFEKIGVIAKEKNEIAYVAEGSNMDDLGDYRPGLQAVAELEQKSTALQKRRFVNCQKRWDFQPGKAIFCLSGFKICIRRNNQQREVDHGGKRRTVIA